MARIFISYKRDVQPDDELAMRIFKALGDIHDVFIDQTMIVGDKWVERIMAELHQCDFIIALLSEHSVCSEMAQKEIEVAHELAQRRPGRPVLLPVRVAYREPYKPPLSTYLDPIHWTLWDREADTPRLLEELRRAIEGGALPLRGALPELIQRGPSPALPPPEPSAPLEAPVGVNPHSRYYVERDTDRRALAAIAREGETIVIKGARQMGKTSLLMRTADAGRQAGKRVAYLDFQKIEQSTLRDEGLFYRRFCSWLSSELELEDEVESRWSKNLGNILNCSQYVSRYLLKQVGSPLVLAMDEVEKVFATGFSSDFFAMLRAWHNDRGQQPSLQRLDLVLVTSTEPYLFIPNLTQSPFNVGEVIELSDFTEAEVAEVNRRHRSPLDAQAEKRLWQLVGGHPYLVRRAVYLVASGIIGLDELFTQAEEDQGPFGDHLRRLLFRLHERPELRTAFKTALKERTCADERLFFRLRGAGLVKREDGATLPRCELYARYFRERLKG